jgi:hypothetical protein
MTPLQKTVVSGQWLDELVAQTPLLGLRLFRGRRER